MQRNLLASALASLLALAGCSGTLTQEEASAPAAKVFPAVKTIMNSRKVPPPVPEYLALMKTDAAGMFSFAQESGAFDLLRQMPVSNGPVSNWMSRGGTIFSFRQGMLVATRGLGDDTMEADASQTLALVTARRNGRAKRFVAHLDGNNHIVQSTFLCDVKNEGPNALAQGTGTVQTTYMTETCYGSDYSFLNLYWIGSQGRILQSRQFTGTLVGLVTFRSLDQPTVQRLTDQLAARLGTTAQ
ncbi:YjbF family lipoprotein [Pseudooceanicola sp. CBS1P-1]|uniref:YjbF family lipoprotein n=1 Tax=Pseudooceanicola albus TaxID=2692189 RepID=A0A6L7G9B5_9RHOB|nr:MULTISPECIES: YjbF family lipoprotein [Pseudooceanicola]MBT9386723.1 YjbF family lipoprotein [Pseudooceanicola endophyticus]MXN20794.1 hypothetical protein [Pseudooceanicola albus]